MNEHILCTQKVVDRRDSKSSFAYSFASRDGSQEDSRRWIKRTLKRALVASGIPACLDALVATRLPEFPCWILAYHSLAGTALHRDSALSISEAQERFSRQLETVMGRCTISSFREVLEAWQAGSSMRAPTLVLTFDDGFMDQYTVAWPVLKKMGLPATFYICPQHIERPEDFYDEQIASYVYRSPCQELTIKEPIPGRWDLRTFRAKRKAIWDLIDIAKPLEKDERTKIIRNWADRLSVSSGTWHHASLFMDWSKVRELAEGGMEIGSHSLTHRSLAGLDGLALEQELEESRRFIEEQVGFLPETFCYPFGRNSDFTPEVTDAAEKAGYRAAVTVIPGWAGKATQRFALPRVSVQPPWEREDLRCALSLGFQSLVGAVPRLQRFIYG